MQGCYGYCIQIYCGKVYIYLFICDDKMTYIVIYKSGTLVCNVMYALVNHLTLYHCFLSINNIVSHAFSSRTAVQRRVIAVEVNIAGPVQTCKYTETVKSLRDTRCNDCFTPDSSIRTCFQSTLVLYYQCLH